MNKLNPADLVPFVRQAVELFDESEEAVVIAVAVCLKTGKMTSHVEGPAKNLPVALMLANKHVCDLLYAERKSPIVAPSGSLASPMGDDPL